MIDYAKSELSRLKDGSGEQSVINKCILEIVDVFAKQGHTGVTAEYTIQVLSRLLRNKPITPLTGEPAEWFETDPNFHDIKQNKRCYSVFMDEDGSAHDLDAIAVSDDGGITWFSGLGFRKKVTFPYYPPIEPERVYIEYAEEFEPGSTSKYEIITDDPERIQKLRDKWKEKYEKE
jgi:hypothetical protein